MAKIVISGSIGWDVTAKDIKKEFKDLKPTEDVEIELNSPGGSVFEGIEISNAIKNHKGKTTLIITSLAASMGSYIAMAADVVKAHDDATFMIHNASTIEWGDHRAMRKTANVLESLTNMLSKAYVKQTGQSKTEIRDLMDDETWLFGDEILNAGFVSELIEVEKPETAEDAVAYQKLVFIDCQEKLKTENSAENELDKLAAYFNTTKPAKVPVNSNQKKENMGFKEFLASLESNPEAKAEFEAHLLANVKTDVEKMALAEVLALAPQAKTDHEAEIVAAKSEIEAGKASEADVNQATKLVATGKYPTCTDYAAKCFAGNGDFLILTQMIAQADQMQAQFDLLQVKVNQTDGLKAEDHDLENDDAKITAEASELGQKFGTAK